MIVYNKDEIKNNLTIDDIYSLLSEWGGNPIKTKFGLTSITICHNEPGAGSRKLYYYSNSSLFQCYTDCAGYFDIFELTIKVYKIQKHQDLPLNQAIALIANKFGFKGYLYTGETDKLQDWQEFDEYERINSLTSNQNHFTLKAYDTKILNNFDYSIRLPDWEKEDITKEAMLNAAIGYYSGGNAITIPHFDIDGNFIGLRGRFLDTEEAEMYGKYRPLNINKVLYTHPLGMNLYGLNWSKHNIGIAKTAIVFESEKSFLKYASYFGWHNNISVACCGSSISNYQIQLLRECGAQEIIVAFDRQFQTIGDSEYVRLKNHILKLKEKVGSNDVTISYIMDINRITGYKDSPIDCGKEKFLTLMSRRKYLE